MSTVLAHPTILCIDDEELALSLRKQVLESAGYIVFTATNAIQGLEVFKANSINLVITDHLLGPGSGSALITELRRLRSDLPIMILSGENTLHALVDPPDYYMHKLEGPREMIAKVRSAIPVRPASKESSIYSARHAPGRALITSQPWRRRTV